MLPTLVAGEMSSSLRGARRQLEVVVYKSYIGIDINITSSCISLINVVSTNVRITKNNCVTNYNKFESGNVC